MYIIALKPFIPYIKNASTMVVYAVHPVIGTVLGNILASIFNNLPTILVFVIGYITVTILSFSFAYIIFFNKMLLFFFFSVKIFKIWLMCTQTNNS